MPSPRTDDPARPLRVVSVSRGSPHRDFAAEIALLGRRVRLERIGTDGDLREAARTYARLQGEADAFGLGGADLELVVGSRRYEIRESAALARHAGRVPVVCGAGLKTTLERRAVAHLDETLAWRGRRVLVTSAIDRWGMTEALYAHGAVLTLGDLPFLLGVPISVRRPATIAAIARVLAPVVTKLPFDWVYPTGRKQRASASGWRARLFQGQEVIAGDFHFLARYAPHDLRGITVLTNTTTPADMADLAARGVKAVATTTPRYDGRSLPTNLLEAAFVAVAGRHPLPTADLEAMVAEAGLEPDLWRATDEPVRPDAAHR
ncbi:MAG: quinate 5-dehydrogenase [Trueperaceae bacterium]|nr:quinate 5-dehydrogenase [Trueperaceae bacterium]